MQGFSQWLTARRAGRGYTQMAQQTGVQRGTWYALEQGSVSPSARTLITLHHHFQIDYTSLMEMVEEDIVRKEGISLSPSHSQ